MKNTKDNCITVGWLIYFLTAVTTVLVASITKQSSILITIVSVFAVIQALLIAKEKRIAFIFGIIRMLIYGYILFGQKIYGGVIYNVGYVVPMFAYGYIYWAKAKKEKKSGVKFLNKRSTKIIIALTIILMIISSIILREIGGNYYILDSITLILGILGMYLMVNKYVEQFYVWIVSDIANIILWGILTIQNPNNLPILLMWIIFLINSTYANILWRKKYT